MANIEPNQYVEYDRWCRREFGGLTPLQRAQVARLKEIDELCKKCRQFPDDQMRCEGTRLVFTPDDSELVTPTRLVLETCHKLDLKTDEVMYTKRVEQSQLHPNLVTKLVMNGSDRVNADVALDQGTLYFDEVPLETLTYDFSKPELVQSLQEYVIACLNCGLLAIYVNTVDFYRSWVKERFFLESIRKMQSPMLDCDWLVIHGIDYSNKASFYREALFNVVQTRASQKKPLTLIQSKVAPVFNNEDEKAFMEEAMKWPQVNLQ